MVDLTISGYKSFAKSFTKAFFKGPVLLYFITIIVVFITPGFCSEVARCGDQLKQIFKGDSSVKIRSDKCRVSSTLARWDYCQKNEDFRKIHQFLKQHPDWPGREILRKNAENDLANTVYPVGEIINYFRKYPPLTGKGAFVYVQALKKTKAKNTGQVARNLFMATRFSIREMERFVQANKPFLTQDALFRKATALLDRQEETKQVKLFFPYLTAKQKKIVNRRLNPVLENLNVKTDTDAGIILDQVRLKRKADLTDEAVALFKTIKKIPRDRAGFFWVEQNILARRLIEKKRYNEAYQVIVRHNLAGGESFANAEWLAGWLSLRFLNKPTQALKHFKLLYQKVRSPISMARASYWLGRTYKVLGRKEVSAAAFREALSHPATYYGQLAYKQIHGKIRPVTLKELTVAKAMRRKFEARTLVQAIHILLHLKENGKAEAFASHLVKQLKSPQERLLLVDLVHKKGGEYLGVQMAKSATVTKSPLIPAAYPGLGEVRKHPVDSAFVHAIIRQESRFKPDAMSPAGALGLMQLMPATAEQTIKKHKLKEGALIHAATNIMVGSHHLKDLLKRFNGSKVLAAAAYNAGASAVENWLVTFGDPRQLKVDVIDWIELIPYAETRNYVQRVLENYYCYLGK